MGTIIEAGIQRLLQRFTEQRRKPRFPCDDPVDISDAITGTQIVKTVLHDISLGGVGFEMPFALSPGKRVLIRTRRIRETATIRYCRATESGFHVGAQFTNMRLWL